MIRKIKQEDIDRLMQIWLGSNIEAHEFISENYWKDNYKTVKTMLPQAVVYVYEDNGQIQGFIGLDGSYIAGIFVEGKTRSKGVGKQLLDYVKQHCDSLSLHVYCKNVRAVKFYKREGFDIKSSQQDENTGEKEYLMCWERNG